MKKIIVGIVIFMMGINVIRAKTYYSDYSEFSDYSSVPVLESDTVNVETETWYKWYREEKELGPYQNQYVYNPDYPLVDLQDSIEGEWGPWGYEKPEIILERILQRRSVYLYQDMKEVRYLHFFGLSGSNQRFYISELEVYVNGNKVDYTITCDNCSEYFKQSIQNGNTKETDVYVDNGVEFRIDLNNYYPADTITFDLYLFDTGYDQKDYRVKMTRDKDEDPNVYFEGYWIQCFTYQSADEIVPVHHSIDQMVRKDPEWYDQKESLEPIEETKVRMVEERDQYRYIDYRQYRCYRIKRIYQDGYGKSGTEEFPFFDADDSMQYYRYRVRDKLVLKEPLVIDQVTMNMQDLILESTKPVDMEGFVDFTRNGEYSITFKMDDLVVTENITVDILENDLRQYEELVIELERIIDEQQKVIEQLQLEKQQLEEVILTEQEMADILREQLISLEDELTNLKQEKETVSNMLDVVKADYEKLQEEDQKKEDVLVELQKQLHSLEQKMEFQEKEMQIIENQKQLLEQQLSEFEVWNQTSKEQIQSLEETLKHRQQELIEFEERKKWLEEQLSELNLQNQTMNETIQTLEKEKQAWYEKFFSGEEKVNDLKLKINELIVENQNLLMNIEQLTTEKESLVENYQQELIRLDLDLVQEKTKLEEANANEYTCRYELEELKTSYEEKTKSENRSFIPRLFLYGIFILGIFLFLIGIYFVIRFKKRK